MQLQQIIRYFKIEEESSLDIAQELERSVERGSWIFLATGIGSLLVWRCGFDVILSDNNKSIISQLLDYQFWNLFLQRVYSNISLCLFALSIFWWFNQYKGAVMREIRILRSCFSEDRVPSNWRELSAPAWISVLAVTFQLLFLFVAYFSDNIAIAGLIIVFIFILDLNGNRIVQTNIKKFFSDKDYKPEGRFARVIEKRRDVVRWYWMHLPQLERVFYCIVFSLVAWQVSLFGFKIAIGPLHVDFSQKFGMLTLAQHCGYVILAAVVITNEIVMRVWRTERSRSIFKINQIERKIRLIRIGKNSFIQEN